MLIYQLPWKFSTVCEPGGWSIYVSVYFDIIYSLSVDHGLNFQLLKFELACRQDYKQYSIINRNALGFYINYYYDSS
jgi:hypothetical protein